MASSALTAEDVDYCKLFSSWLTEEDHAPLPSSESRNKKGTGGWGAVRLSALWCLHSTVLCMQSVSPVTFDLMLRGLEDVEL